MNPRGCSASAARTAACSSRVIAPLPVQPSTKTTSAGSWWAARWSRARGSRPRPRTIETARCGRSSPRRAAQRRMSTPIGVPARASDTSTGGRGRPASTSSVTTPTATANARRRREALLETARGRPAGLVLHRQRLAVVRAAGLDGGLAALDRRLERDVAEVGEQPADLVGRRRRPKPGPRSGSGVGRWLGTVSTTTGPATAAASTRGSAAGPSSQARLASSTTSTAASNPRPQPGGATL